MSTQQQQQQQQPQQQHGQRHGSVDEGSSEDVGSPAGDGQADMFPMSPDERSGMGLAAAAAQVGALCRCC